MSQKVLRISSNFCCSPAEIHFKVSTWIFPVLRMTLWFASIYRQMPDWLKSHRNRFLHCHFQFIISNIPHSVLYNLSCWQFLNCKLWVVMMMMIIMYTLVHNIVWPVVANISETITDEVMRRLFGPDIVVAEIIHSDRPGVQTKMSDVPLAEKLEKFVEDVKWVGITIVFSSMYRIRS